MFFYGNTYIQAGTKCVHDRNRARVVHTITLTVHDKSRTLFQFKKNHNLIWFIKFLLLTYLSQKRKKILTHLIHYFKPLLVSTLLNILAVVTLKCSLHFPKIHRSILCKITIDLFYFSRRLWRHNLWEKNFGRSMAYSCRTNVFI